MGKIEDDNLLLWTSYITKDNLDLLKDLEILPIFIGRNILGSPLTAPWHGTAVHIPELSPSPELLTNWVSGLIPDSEFEHFYYKELRALPLLRILHKITLYVELSGAKGAVLMGYANDPTLDPRSYLARYLNREELVKGKAPVREISFLRVL